MIYSAFFSLLLHYILWIFKVVKIIGGGGGRDKTICLPPSQLFSLGATATTPPQYFHWGRLPPPNIFTGGDCPPPPQDRRLWLRWSYPAGVCGLGTFSQIESQCVHCATSLKKQSDCCCLYLSAQWSVMSMMIIPLPHYERFLEQLWSRKICRPPPPPRAHPPLTLSHFYSAGAQNFMADTS